MKYINITMCHRMNAFSGVEFLNNQIYPQQQDLNKDFDIYIVNIVSAELLKNDKSSFNFFSNKRESSFLERNYFKALLLLKLNLFNFNITVLKSFSESLDKFYAFGHTTNLMCGKLKAIDLMFLLLPNLNDFDSFVYNRALKYDLSISGNKNIYLFGAKHMFGLNEVLLSLISNQKINSVSKGLNLIINNLYGLLQLTVLSSNINGFVNIKNKHFSTLILGIEQSSIKKEILDMLYFAIGFAYLNYKLLMFISNRVQKLIINLNILTLTVYYSRGKIGINLSFNVQKNVTKDLKADKIAHYY